MTRPDFTAALLAAFRANSQIPIWLVELQLDSGTQYYWTGIGELTWSGHTWVGAGELGAIGGVEETIDGKPRQLTLSVSGLASATAGAALTENYMDRPAILYLGALDSDGALIVDPVIFVYGYIVHMDATVGVLADDGGDSIAITVEDETALGEQSPALRWTDAAQQARFPGDLGLQYLDQLQNAKPVWRGRTGGVLAGSSGATKGGNV